MVQTECINLKKRPLENTVFVTYIFHCVPSVSRHITLKLIFVRLYSREKQLTTRDKNNNFREQNIFFADNIVPLNLKDQTRPRRFQPMPHPNPPRGKLKKHGKKSAKNLKKRTKKRLKRSKNG